MFLVNNPAALKSLLDVLIEKYTNLWGTNVKKNAILLQNHTHFQTNTFVEVPFEQFQHSFCQNLTR